MRQIGLLALLLLLINGSLQQENDSIVKISSGQLIGEHRGHFYAFEGIPYAEAPLGELRFEPPRPYEQVWTESRNAKQVGELQALLKTEVFLSFNEIFRFNVPPMESFAV